MRFHKFIVNMSIFGVSLILLISCNKRVGESKFYKPGEVKSELKTNFPEDWLGYWEGELKIFNPEGLVQTLPMALDLGATEVDTQWVWAIIYGEDTIKGRRDYLLNEINKEKGHYQVDEKNSIYLDCYLINDRLFSDFEVMGNRLMSIYHFDGEHMHFDIIVGKNEAHMVTGDSLVNGSEIPAVSSFKTISTQKGVLKRKKTLSK